MDVRDFSSLTHIIIVVRLLFVDTARKMRKLTGDVTIDSTSVSTMINDKFVRSARHTIHST